MMNAVLQDSGWIEDERFLAENWNEMIITDPTVPVAGIWMDGLYICLYSDQLQTSLTSL